MTHLGDRRALFTRFFEILIVRVLGKRGLAPSILVVFKVQAIHPPARAAKFIFNIACPARRSAEREARRSGRRRARKCRGN